ncbi:MAG: TonB-dependent receptor [Bacteroidaceae bacterium]|nr:TonB-dependent receptor [Bacteroidaceae bacterium]
MKTRYVMLSLLCYAMTMTAQNHRMENGGKQVEDSTDVFYQHLQLKEVMVTGVTGDTKLKHSTAPISVVTGKELRQTTSTNVIDAVAKQPGMAQITTGGGISKPIIRGLGYNRIIVMNEGVRQEGQQWGDEHGVEVDEQSVGSVEILKGPASLMYGSDAMAGVLILHGAPSPLDGEVRANVSTEYQTNNGLFAYSLNAAGHHGGFVWDGRFSDKMAHAYKNKYDGYVPGSQFRERAGRLMMGLEKQWGHSHLTWTCYHLTPSIIEGERDEDTGELTSYLSSLTSYRKSLPFQQVKHYKAVWDNSINLPKGYLKAIVGYQQNRRQEFEESMDDYEVFFKLHTVTYDVRYLTQEFDGWKLAVGTNGMWQRSQNLGEEALIPEYRLFDFGGYATASKSWKRWTLNGGLRYDTRHLKYEHTKDFEGVTGSVGAVWNASEHLDVRLNVARGFRAPNMSELGADGVHEGTVRYELGSANLKPEYSWQADLGVDFTSHYVEAQVALFANRISNYIFTKRVDVVKEEGYNTYQYTQGDARLLGFEAGVDVHPVHRLHLGNTFSYVDARQLNQPEETRYLPFTPAPRWTSEVKYEITHQGKIFNNAYVALGLECYLRQHHYYKEDQTETATPSYTLLNFSLGTDLMIRKRKVAELYLTADNLLNRAYQNHLSRLKYTDINVATGRMGVYNMGRNVVMKVVVPIEVRGVK